MVVRACVLLPAEGPLEGPEGDGPSTPDGQPSLRHRVLRRLGKRPVLRRFGRGLKKLGKTAKRAVMGSSPSSSPYPQEAYAPPPGGDYPPSDGGGYPPAEDGPGAQEDWPYQDAGASQSYWPAQPGGEPMPQPSYPPTPAPERPPRRRRGGWDEERGPDAPLRQPREGDMLGGRGFEGTVSYSGSGASKAELRAWDEQEGKGPGGGVARGAAACAEAGRGWR
jgi:hypothetical protein